MSNEPATTLNIGFAAFSALIARFISHPLDTLKTHIQYSSGKTSSIPTTILPYFRGVQASLFFSVPATAVYLSSYDIAKKHMAEIGFAPTTLCNHALSAAIAELLSGAFWTPMEVIKSKVQINHGISMTTVCTSVYRSHGLKGFYRGYILSQMVYIPYTITYFVVYEKLKEQWINANRESISSWGYMSCSCIAAILGGIVSNPFDVVKTRVQVDSSRHALSVITKMYQENGLRSFSRGMGARVLWIVPSMTISITLYEMLKDSFST